MKSKKKISDKEIADGIFQEVKATMQRIENSHMMAETKGPLKSDYYSQMKVSGYWDARKIVAEYLLIKEKKSQLSANLRQRIAVIFSTASTNFWAKRMHDEKKDTQEQK